MKELLVIIATAMPEEKIVSQLEDAIDEHKIFYSDETRKKLAAMCQMLILRTVTEGSAEKAESLLKDMKQQEQRESLFNINPS